MYFQQGVMPF